MSFQGMKSCTGAAFQVCMYTMLSGTEYGDRVGCSERHDAVITSNFVMQMNVFGLYIKIIYFLQNSNTTILYIGMYISLICDKSVNSEFGIFELLV
jgi:hypothetical protein